MITLNVAECLSRGSKIYAEGIGVATSVLCCAPLKGQGCVAKGLSPGCTIPLMLLRSERAGSNPLRIAAAAGWWNIGESIQLVGSYDYAKGGKIFITRF